jgi:hypothetical protein
MVASAVVAVVVVEMMPSYPALRLLRVLLRLLLQPHRLRMLVLVVLRLVLVQCPTLVPEVQALGLLRRMRRRPVQLLVQALVQCQLD